MMWVGLWNEFGINAYLRLSSLGDDDLLDVLFCPFEAITEVICDAEKKKNCLLYPKIYSYSEKKSVTVYFGDIFVCDIFSYSWYISR